ncbi:MAG: hypothetical protein F9K29_16325 [Hyphomicrobiaceae bacterium]|nr:MAG: hypothetical protein F9K29_16325 [Hyphomicrobiaceae bacterium]
MKLPDTKIILFNIAAGLVSVAAIVAAVRSFLITPGVAPCSERYASGTVFALEREGVIQTPVDLQARLGGRDVGLVENAVVSKAKIGPVPVALSVNLPKGSASPHSSATPTGGVSFSWEPKSIQAKTSACLAYSVLLPEGFEFGRGGVLPGIRGADADRQGQDGFISQLVWRAGGRVGVTNRVTSNSQLRVFPYAQENAVFPRGRWTKVEQEVVLGAPKETKGVVRVWIDGRLVLDVNAPVLRGKPDVAISGVAVDAFYSGDDASGGAPADTRLSLSPLEIRWQ